MINSKGGRGNKVPYKTVILRVPEDVRLQVEAISSTYKELKLLGKEDELQEFINRVESAIVSTVYKGSTNLLTLEQATELANKLLAQKKSKQQTVEKLLQVLYNQE